jgi:hypothetical protein
VRSLILPRSTASVSICTINPALAPGNLTLSLFYPVLVSARIFSFRPRAFGALPDAG